MWAIAGILAVAVLVAAIEVPSYVKQRKKKEIWIFSLLLLFATGLGVAQSLQVPIPNPLDWIAVIFGPFSHWGPS